MLTLDRLLEGGEIIEECPVQTTEGVRVADVTWMSRRLWQMHRKATVLAVAPEICVEIVSPSNSREEMREKMALYFAKGAQEVWLCDEEGRMVFFTALSAPAPVAKSVLCPDFPPQIDVD
jgi:Uma2 family endonuclease